MNIFSKFQLWIWDELEGKPMTRWLEKELKKLNTVGEILDLAVIAESRYIPMATETVINRLDEFKLDEATKRDFVYGLITIRNYVVMEEIGKFLWTKIQDVDVFMLWFSMCQCLWQPKERVLIIRHKLLETAKTYFDWKQIFGYFQRDAEMAPRALVKMAELLPENPGEMVQVYGYIYDMDVADPRLGIILSKIVEIMKAKNADWAQWNNLIRLTDKYVLIEALTKEYKKVRVERERNSVGIDDEEVEEIKDEK